MLLCYSLLVVLIHRANAVTAVRVSEEALRKTERMEERELEKK